MDNLDQLLARTLQAEEDGQAAQQQQQELTPKQREVLGILTQNQSKARSVEDPQLMERARGLMRLDAWRAAAREEYELNRQLQEPGSTSSCTAVDDLVVKSLLQWFKHEFFAWVNSPPCATCGSTSTQHARMDAPSAAERPHAGRVEVHSCAVCGQETRFPRYTSPAKLLESRRGRCGEWAHCFLLMLRAAGYDARHVCDNADHVWCEYYSQALGRWVHVDSCEAAWDTPLLYEGGWGKALGFVLAASWHGHADVTRRYVLPTALPQLPTRRAGVPDGWLVSVLTQATTRLRQHLGQSQRRALAARDAAEMLQLMMLESAPAAAAAAAAAAADLPGRQSGAEAWRQARGETGLSGSSIRPAVPPPGTNYARADDNALPQLFSSAGRMTGGVCRASGQHTACSPSQIAQRLFDGSLGTKWLDFGGGGAQGSAWVEYRLMPSQEAVTVTHYDVVCGEDCPERDPCDWVLEAADGGESGSSSSWVVLHECRGHRFSRRHQLCSFTVPQGARVASRAWRLRVTRAADPSSATCVQLACWNLYSQCTRQQSAGSGREQEQQLLYLDSGMCRQLQQQAAAVGDSSSSAAFQEGLSTLRRILTNMQQQQPSPDPKFFKLSVKAAKLQALLAQPLLQAALFAAGFRPLLLLPVEGGSGALSLVADDSSNGDVQAAVRTLLTLLADAGSGGGGSAGAGASVV